MTHPPAAGRLAGRVAVVTGAGGAIGAAISRRLADDGAAVLVADLDEASAAAVAADLGRSGGLAAPARLDVLDRASVVALPEAARTAFGETPTVLVCNAGVQTFGHAVDITTQEWDRVLDVNARGVAYCLQMVGTHLPDQTAVVAISSVQARLAAPYFPHYAASKAAVLSLVRSFALTLAPRRIRVNAVAPGMVDTPLWERAGRELATLRGVEPAVARAERIAAVPLRRAGTPQDVASAVSFLVSEEASYITGETLHVCGGDVMP